MKKFLCADVVPGCNAVVRRSDKTEVISAAADHLAEHHGMTISPELHACIDSLVRGEGIFAALRRA